MLLRNVRLVPVGTPAPSGPVDVRIDREVVADVRPGLPRTAGEPVLDGDGRWLAPGLWDAHTHLGQWARRSVRLDVAGTRSREEVADRVRAAAGTELLVGSGYRPATWPEPPTVAALDAAAARPVVLVSGDAHAGWLNSAALRLLGLPGRTGPVVEAEWFDLVPRVLALEDARTGPQAYTAALSAAAGRGVVGVVDLEFEPGFRRWPERWAAVGMPLRVRTSTYPADLAEALAAGLRTGQPLVPDGLVTMGPLKVISDGSLNTRTAHCCEPYADGGHGVQNVDREQLVELLTRARAGGLRVALHALGDAAVEIALAAFTEVGGGTAARPGGVPDSIEHAQLLRAGQASRMAALGLVASVQPAHLLDDRSVTAGIWGEDGAVRSFTLRSLVDAGVRLALGSDAPVAPLDPWLAMAAAVHRGEPGEPAWYPEQSLSPAEAFAASTDGRRTVAAGSPADLVLLDADPLAGADPAAAAANLRAVPVAATWVAGAPVHRAL